MLCLPSPDLPITCSTSIISAFTSLNFALLGLAHLAAVHVSSMPGVHIRHVALHCYCWQASMHTSCVGS